MNIKSVTLSEAEEIFREYGLEVVLWVTANLDNGKYSGRICDYRKYPGYTVAFACDIKQMDATGYWNQVERFNVMKCDL